MTPNTKVKKWSHFLKAIRHFLDERGFFEVTTPHLVSAGAFEATIDTLKVTWGENGGELHSSPEMEMKRVLSETSLPIYQICQCFRDDPPSPVHTVEFTMLEFYRVNADYKTIEQDMKDLLRTLTTASLPFEQWGVAELFEKHLGFDLTQHYDKPKLQDTVRAMALLEPTHDDDWSDIFFKLMLDYIEPKLNPDIPTIVRDYPPAIAALARLGQTGRLLKNLKSTGTRWSSAMDALN